MMDNMSGLSEDEICQVVEKNLGSHDFHLINTLVKPAGSSPLGFNGEHIKIEVTVLVHEKNVKLHYFVKKTPTSNKVHLEYLGKAGCFYKEIGVFKSILGLLSFKQNRKWFPDYYYSRGNEMIVFKDVSENGYYMYPERELLTEDYIIKSLDSIAAMHASAIVLEEKSTCGEFSSLNVSNNRKKNLGEMFSHLFFETEASGDPNHPGHHIYETGIKAQVELVNYLDEFTDDEKKVIREKLPSEMRRIYKLVKPSEKYKNVLVHADLWTNNFLFKDDENGKVDHALIIDFQLARYAPPAHDVSMFLHLVQSKDFRDENATELLEYYYKAFSNELELNGLKAEELLPRNEFIESYNYYQELAILTALFYFQTILTPGDISAKFLSSPELYKTTMFVDRNKMLKECFLTDEIVRSRTSETMIELARKYILL